MLRRLIVLSLLFMLTAGYSLRAMRPEVVPPRETLAHMPQQLGDWQGRDAQPFTKEIVDVLGVDEYVSRLYSAKGQPPVSLYLGYYQSQREGDTIHSPMNCLPGAGWQPVLTARAAVTVPGRAEPIVVNRFVIQKGTDRQAVLYWYQSQGRVVASEYWSKIYMVLDAVRTNRSDAALIRVVTPIDPSAGGDQAAFDRLENFTRSLFPQLERFLPS